MMEYKGYVAKVEFDDEAGVFHGEVINTRDVITFQGDSVKTLKRALRDSVDDYLSFCLSRGEEPDRPFSGQFVTRVSPELHRQVSFAAMASGKSLNGWVSEQLQTAVERVPSVPSQRSYGPRKRSPKASRKRQWPLSITLRDDDVRLLADSRFAPSPSSTADKTPRRSTSAA